MRIPTIPVLLAAAPAAAAILPASPGATAHGLGSVPPAAPAFLQQAGAVTVLPPTGPAPRSHLPDSIMPHRDDVCSVDTSDPGSPPTCSTNLSTVACSAHPDGRQFCSATADPQAGTGAQCSALGSPGVRCSVLPPRMDQDGGSQCSVVNGRSPAALVLCSVIPPSGSRRDACSAVNPVTTTSNFCSSVSIGSGAAASCSVLNGGVSDPNFCTTGFAGLALCSAAGAQGGDQAACSLLAGEKGACTALLGAASGQCSTYLGTGSFCSVIGGSPGRLCRQ